MRDNNFYWRLVVNRRSYS